MVGTDQSLTLTPTEKRDNSKIVDYSQRIALIFSPNAKLIRNRHAEGIPATVGEHRIRKET